MLHYDSFSCPPLLFPQKIKTTLTNPNPIKIIMSL